MFKKFSLTLSVMLCAAILAVGYGRFVYPVNPLIVWCLLFVCWLCYRLRRRAIATFGSRPYLQTGNRRRHLDTE